MKISAFQGVQRLILYEQKQTIVTGTIVIAWQGESNRDFNRQDLIFHVPSDNSGLPLIFDPQFEPQALVMAFPATIENRSKGGDNNIGWGVDLATIALVAGEQGAIAQVTTKLVVEGQHSYLIRIGFLATITAVPLSMG